MGMATTFLSRKVVIVAAILAVGAVAAALAATSIAQANAQEKMMWTNQEIPRINGSVSVANEMSSFLSENVKVSFVAAAETAQGQVPGGTVLGGHLGVMQGYLVYTFFVANTGNQTGQLVIVDAGNGDVLYSSEAQPFGAFGHPMFGQGGGPEYGGWHGTWKGNGWGPWH